MNLHVPSQELDLVEKICEHKTPYEQSVELDTLFLNAMKQVTQWHQAHCEFYKKLLVKNKFSWSQIKSIEDLVKLPPVWAHFFKAYEIISVPRSQVTLHLTSSGTQGQKSQVFFDQWSIGSAQRMLDWIFEYNGWVTPQQKCNYVLFTYETEASSRLGTAYTDNYLCSYAPANEVFYALKRTGHGGHDFDLYGTIAQLKRFAEQGLPVRIFGFPSFFYFTLQRMKDLKLQNLKLHSDSLVFLGGGWKSHRDKEISKAELYATITEQLGIADLRLRDGFGSTEHCIPYVECSHHQFHIPVWSRVFIRDFKTLRPLPHGQVGFLHFVSPYMTSMPAQSVIMGDAGYTRPGSDCGCGLKTDFFVKTGRAGVSKNKSCAISASEMLKKFSHEGAP
jgi:phenylacetate-coenzyme A ligase PaaK-like adenylate-forming protein